MSDPVLEFFQHGYGCTRMEDDECMCDIELGKVALGHYQKVLAYKEKLEKSCTNAQKQIDELLDFADELADQLEKTEADKEKLEAELETLLRREEQWWWLINNSYGVVGLHHNGAVAPWDDLLPGGKFDWLSEMASEDEQDKGGE